MSDPREALAALLKTSPVPLAKWLPSGRATHLNIDDRVWIADHLVAALRSEPTLDYLRAENAGLRQALALANSMIRSGERHSPLSEQVIVAALDAARGTNDE
jgi:hypothetical protein